MSEKKQSFLVGAILGCFISLFLFTALSVLLIFNTKEISKKIAYQVNVDSIINEAVSKASPSVVGVVKFKNDKESGTGSGVIYKLTNDLAYIVTNQHVIDKGDKIEVAFENEDRVIATLVGEDVITDLAVITIPRNGINHYLDFADSDKLKVGEFVLAIGNPLGLKFYGSATLGIVSSLERLIPIDVDKDGESDWVARVIQTDAAINPGNSGGALINIDGKLVGINSMKIAGELVEGLGFSIPSKIVYKVVNDLEIYHEVQRPYLGIHAISVNKIKDDDKVNLGINYLEKGVYVNDVTYNSSAYKNGLLVNDIITKVNNKDVKDLTDFRLQLYDYAIGDTVKFTVIRNNTLIDISIKLEAKK